ncbi:pilus assembly protein TadG-related protein [Nocardiopsis lambiniae]|uniref:Pilus assembly protein TadG-related protein n=1 Tax=Nocardiopsis lambiniae TaxID=3075539 RepID=A0ABU2M4S2_9ACTN|nr:pilus assembly protein TadG-related protein [Nocardiopsis sp. DSM 44743]MDT0327597.1 pilus assembly protein TadG-related protein [Nocardiopsis sp. DSM 44743]
MGPLPPSRPRPRHLLGHREDGQANILLLFGLTLALLALTLLFVRVGAAGDQRSRAQTAADAAALAAVSAMQEKAAEALVAGDFPMPLFDEDVARERAEEYARANDAVVTDIRASDNVMGRNGNIVRVEVRGAICQKELEADGSRHWGDVVCDGEDDSTGRVGTAAAIAIAEFPECGRDSVGISCAGIDLTDLDRARRAVDVHLVDKEGRYKFDPAMVAFGGGAVVDCSSLGRLHPVMCQVHETLQVEFPGFYLSAGGYRNEPGSDHGQGMAVDYMMAPLGHVPTPQMHQTALTVVDWIIQNAHRLGVKGLIYDHHIWNAASDPVGPWESVRRFHQNSGNLTQDHVDHIHLAAGPGRML